MLALSRMSVRASAELRLFVVLAVFVVALGLSLPGCGGDDPGAGATMGGQTTEQMLEEPQAGAGGPVLLSPDISVKPIGNDGGATGEGGAVTAQAGQPATGQSGGSGDIPVPEAGAGGGTEPVVVDPSETGPGAGCVVSSTCDDGLTCTDNVCCQAEGCGLCATCDTPDAPGTCSFLPAGSQDPAGGCVGNRVCDGNGSCGLSLGGACDDNSECNSGACVDGVCCATDGCGTCQACNLPGSIGVCANLPLGEKDAEDPLNDAAESCGVETDDVRSCNGQGQCLANDGESCEDDDACLSGNCVDGVCCGVASCDSCQSCATGDTPGTCGFVAKGDIDTNGGCLGDNACDGAGACKLVDGQSCSTVDDCVSGFCTDAVCCGTACDETCFSCNQDGDQGVVRTLGNAHGCQRRFLHLSGARGVRCRW